jgi:predicted transcriptional regulator of viral defense system
MENKAKKGDYLDILLRAKNTIFTTKDISLLWRESQTGAVKSRMNYYIKTGKLLRLRRGIYAKDENYDKYELAVKILRPAYISFETVLGSAGLTFQYYSQIFVASYVKREIKYGEQIYLFQKMKESILRNPTGIDQSGEYAIATKERAFLDTIYRSQNYYFDNLGPLNWERVFEILPIYQNKKMVKKVQTYYNNYQKNK